MHIDIHFDEYYTIWEASASGRKETDALGFSPLSPKGVITMTDYELLAIVLLVITLAFSIHNGTHK